MEISLGLLSISWKILNIFALDFFTVFSLILNKFCTFKDHFKMLSLLISCYHWRRLCSQGTCTTGPYNFSASNKSFAISYNVSIIFTVIRDLANARKKGILWVINYVALLSVCHISPGKYIEHPMVNCLQSAFSLKIRGPVLFSASANANNDVTINSLARLRRSRAWVTRGMTL